ncbi:MAG: hypothetical protein ACK57N_06360 [Planctomycetia bacterium]|jgi:hypothetical protein
MVQASTRPGMAEPVADGRGSAQARGNEEAQAALSRLLADLGEAGTHMRTLLLVRAERRKLLLRRLARRAIMGVVALLALGPLLLAGVAYAVVGWSQLLHELSGGRDWLANLATGTSILALVAACAWWLRRRAQARALESFEEAMGRIATGEVR